MNTGYLILLILKLSWCVSTLLPIWTGNIAQAAVWYGLVVHFRIYPIIYALPIVLVLDPKFFRPGQKPVMNCWASDNLEMSQSTQIVARWNLQAALKFIFSRERIMFGLISGAVFLLCTGLSFYLYKWEFLHEALLYHLTRTDPRHNFSIYFYHIYLHYGCDFTVVEKLISFLPQFAVQLVVIFCFAWDLPFCIFVQTVAFVAFNKVGHNGNFFLSYFFETNKMVCASRTFILLNIKLTGDHGTVLRMVFLLITSYTSLECYAV